MESDPNREEERDETLLGDADDVDESIEEQLDEKLDEEKERDDSD
jgi:hypothetical protein